MSERHKSKLPLALRATYLAMHRQSDAVFGQFGITADQFVLMASLDESDALTQRELAKRISSDPSTVRAMLVLLERQGLISRTVHPEDSRALSVSLTASGKRKFRQLWKAGEVIRERMIGSLSESEAEVVIELLGRVESALLANSEVASDSA
jgi:DNA-binding MarR family transcriptional regulator